MESKKPKDDIGFLIKFISHRIQSFVDADMKDHELTFSQLHVLGYLACHESESTQKELEDYLGVAHPTVVGLVSRLEKKGFIRTWMDEHDRRIKRIQATDKAAELHDRVQQGHIRIEELMRNGLSSQEVSELLRMLRIVYNNLEKCDR